MNRTKAKKTKVETVHVGNARVKIYRRVRTVAGNAYPTFEVCDFTSGRRKLRSFAYHKAALDEAMRIARLLSTGGRRCRFYVWKGSRQLWPVP